ncbi:MAG: hypothetical protein WD794_05555 [Mycobacteriales bacterium]
MTAGPPPVGSAAEEAARLFAVAQEWVCSRGGAHLDGLATGAPECSACPVCQGIAAIRSVQPETVEHLLDAAASFVAAVRTAAGSTGAASTAAAPREPGSSRPGVQRIDVRED